MFAKGHGGSGLLEPIGELLTVELGGKILDNSLGESWQSGSYEGQWGYSRIKRKLLRVVHMVSFTCKMMRGRTRADKDDGSSMGRGAGTSG